MSGLVTFALYCAPSLIALYRTSTGKPITGPLALLVLMNIFLGWTVVGWLLPLANAFGFNPVAWVTLRLVKVLPAGPGGPIPQGMPGTPQPSACFQCHGSGSMSCSTCGGRGSWYDPPQGEHGMAQLRTCPACMSSGHVRCTSCSGTGRAAVGL